MQRRLNFKHYTVLNNKCPRCLELPLLVIDPPLSLILFTPSFTRRMPIMLFSALFNDYRTERSLGSQPVQNGIDYLILRSSTYSFSENMLCLVLKTTKCILYTNNLTPPPPSTHTHIHFFTHCSAFN